MSVPPQVKKGGVRSFRTKLLVAMALVVTLIWLPETAGKRLD